MTAPVAAARLRPPLAAGSAVVAALGCGALAARPALINASGNPLQLLVVSFCALLVVGLAVPLPPPLPLSPLAVSTRRVVPFALAVGILAFACGRVLAHGHAPTRFTTTVVLANLLAAVAEEVWFRRLCYGLLAPAGPVVAVAGSTALFALVHVSIYGFWILPLDLAAGAVLGWQRAVTGSWTTSALTHMLANLLVIL